VSLSNVVAAVASGRLSVLAIGDGSAAESSGGNDIAIRILSGVEYGGCG
jgi:hypothetical protein